MAFFLIVPSIMIISIVLMHALTKRLGLQIYYPTLVAVAVLSIMADFAATLIMPAGGKEFLLRLGLIVFAASLLLTFANRFLVNKQREEEQRFTEEVKAAYAAEVQSEVHAAPSREDTTFDESPPISRYNEFSAVEYNENPDAKSEDKPAVDAEVAKSEDKPAVDVEIAKSEDKPAVDAEVAKSEDKPAVDVEVTKSEDKPAVDAEVAKSEDKPAVDAEVAKSEDKPAVDVEVTKSEDKPAIDAEVAKSEDKPAVDVEVTKSEDKPAVDVEVTKSEDKPAVEDEILKASQITAFDVEVAESDDEPAAESGTAEAEEISAFDVKISKTGTETDPVIDLEVKKLLSEEKSEEEIAELLDGGVFEPLPEVKPEEADKPIETPKDEPEEKFPLEEVFKPLPEVKPEVPEQTEQQPEPEKPVHVELFPLQEVFKPLSMLRLDKIEEMTLEEKNSAPEPTQDESEDAEQEQPGTLDDILDKAYGERMKGHVWQAIDLYQIALERYRNDEYAPFVAIDLGNIYKEEALYSKAVKIYESALTLPAVKRNSEIKKEFTANLTYLRVVRDVLLKHHEMSTPFGKLSKEILQEIDREFEKARLHR